MALPPLTAISRGGSMPLMWYHSRCREALRMVRAYAGNRRMRAIYLERAADYRECIVDQMRKRAGWSLAERVAGKRQAKA